VGWRDWFNRNNDEAYKDIIQNYTAIIDNYKQLTDVQNAELKTMKEVKAVAYIHQMRVMSLLGLLQDVSETLVMISGAYSKKKVFSTDQMKELVTYMAVTTTDIVQHNKQYNKRTDPVRNLGDKDESSKT